MTGTFSIYTNLLFIAFRYFGNDIFTYHHEFTPFHKAGETSSRPRFILSGLTSCNSAYTENSLFRMAEIDLRLAH